MKFSNFKNKFSSGKTHLKKYGVWYVVAIILYFAWGELKAYFAAGRDHDKTNKDMLKKVEDMASSNKWNSGGAHLEDSISGDLIYAAMDGPGTNKEVLREYLTISGLYGGNPPEYPDMNFVGVNAAAAVLSYGVRTLKGSIPLISAMLPERDYTLPLALMSELDLFDISLKNDINKFFEPLNIKI